MYKKIEYDTWNELKSLLAHEICKSNIFPCNKYIFRGQKDADWKLISTFDRNYGKLSFSSKQCIEIKLLNKFKKMCIEWEGKENFKHYDIHEIMSAAQHYGLPTRLLDWTYSYYIAAFFAFCEEVVSSHVAIWIINSEHEIWQGRYGVSIEKSSVVENERQKYQYGIFTRNNTVNSTLEEYVEECAKACNVDKAIYKVILPATERKSVLQDLEMMGINYYTLFRGIEGCAKAALLNVYLS